ncbi:MAG: zinc ABC transporter substrate-binding protein [Clostridia bacterium]|nr:zinc ABC transporter substrate-binding protein [Clostridia bacterium]
MKKILILIISVFLLCSCSLNQSVNDEKKIKITATIFPQYDFSRQIAGDLASVSMLLPAGAESHTFEPTPKDIVEIENSDIFIYTGGESDMWIKDILNDISNTDLKIISLSDICTNNEEHSHTTDEHFWTSPKNVLKICEKIRDTLCEIDYENKTIYESNFKLYESQLLELDNAFKNAKTDAKRNILIFGDRFPFKHLTDEYSIEYLSAFPGCAEETEPDIKTIMNLINKVNEDVIPVVFYSDFSDHKIADTICEKTNSKPLMLRSCHTATEEELLNGVTYIDLMMANAQKIKEALN